MEFKELEFKSFLDGFRSSYDFDNGYYISVVAGAGMYSNPKEGNSPDDFNLFEVAVFNPEGKWSTKDFFPGIKDDVMGWQSREDINDLILLIESK